MVNNTMKSGIFYHVYVYFLFIFNKAKYVYKEINSLFLLYHMLLLKYGIPILLIQGGKKDGMG
jgi:hypothetical protein